MDEFQLYYTDQCVSQHPLLLKAELQHVNFSFVDSTSETKINITNKLQKTSQHSWAVKEFHQLEHIFELFEHTKWGVTNIPPLQPFNEFINSYEFIYMKP